MSRNGLSRPIILGLALVLCAAATLGLSFGLWVARLDETRVINRAAAEYASEGGNVGDCIARPGSGTVWLVVSCGKGVAVWSRAFNRLGFSVSVPTSDLGT